jgi:hypothetical protein
MDAFLELAKKIGVKNAQWSGLTKNPPIKITIININIKKLCSSSF